VNRSTLHCDLEQTGLVFARTFTTALQVFRNFIVYTDILAGANVLAVVVRLVPLFLFCFFLEEYAFFLTMFQRSPPLDTLDFLTLAGSKLPRFISTLALTPFLGFAGET
jgi:hypothetical protein